MSTDPSEIGVSWEENDESIPFPLLYEHFLESSRRDITEYKVRSIVVKYISNLKKSAVNKFFDIINSKHVITTNYDLATLSSITGCRRCKNHAPSKEKEYSLLRRTEGREKVGWQIHGSEEYKSTIMLGYDLYSRYLSQIKKYITEGVKYENTKIDSLKSRALPDGLNEVHTWVDFFFLSKPNTIHIIGLSMDWIEIHLWYMLTQRYRLDMNQDVKNNTSIIYHVRSDVDRGNPVRHSKKLKLLRSKGVKVNEHDKFDSWGEYYMGVAKII